MSEHTTISMTEREQALYLAGVAKGRADGFTDAAAHLEKNAKLVPMQQWTANMSAWFAALAKDVSKAGSKKLGQAITQAAPNLQQPAQAIEKFMVDSASALRAKAEAAKAEFGARLVQAEAPQAKRKGGVIRQFARNLLEELEKG